MKAFVNFINLVTPQDDDGNYDIVFRAMIELLFPSNMAIHNHNLHAYDTPTAGQSIMEVSTYWQDYQKKHPELATIFLHLEVIGEDDFGALYHHSLSAPNDAPASTDDCLQALTKACDFASSQSRIHLESGADTLAKIYTDIADALQVEIRTLS